MLADLTLYAPDGLQIVALEKFETLTADNGVDCNAADGTMSLKFKSKEAYNYALKKWSFINENKDDRFLLIANHAGCGPDDQRQPYLISSVDDQADKLLVVLAAEEVPWSRVAGNYDLAWGQAAPPSRKLKSRGWWDDVKDGLGDAYEAGKDAVEEVGEGVSDAVQGNANLAKSVSFSVAAGKEGQKTPLYKDPDGKIALDCVDCFVEGRFTMTGHIKVQGWKLKDLSIDTSPKGFGATLKLEATITASTAPKSLGNQKEIFSAPVPYAGVRVPGIFKLGAVFSYVVGFNTTFKGEGVVDFGLQATLPDTAKATVNLAGPADSSASGFSGALKPLFEVKSLSASVNVAAYSKPKLAFGIELEKVGKADVSLILKLPEVSSTLTAKYAAEGLCEDDAKKTKTGVQMKNEVKVSLEAEVNAEMGSDEDNALPKWSKELWSYPKELPGLCFPIKIPGLGPDNTGDAEAPKKSTTPTAPTGGGGGGGCKKVKRDRLGRRRVVAC